MVFSSKIQTNKCPLSRSKIFYLSELILLFFILIGVSRTMAACVDYSVDLSVDNRMPIGVKVIYSQHYNDGSSNFVHTSGIIDSGTTGKVRTGIINGISSVPKIVLQAEDSSGKVVWQKMWTGIEFVKLKDVGWKIIVSPETSDPLIAP